MMAGRRAYMGLSYLYVLGVVVQVFLAGIGIFGDFADDLNAHRDFVHVLELLSVLMLVAAVIGRMGWAFIGVPIGLLLLVELQYFWVSEDNSRWLKAVHPTMAIVLFAIAHFAAQRAGMLIKGQAVLGAAP
jgi:hypothetical protein